jgi:hypothetical protein
VSVLKRSSGEGWGATHRNAVVVLLADALGLSSPLLERAVDVVSRASGVGWLACVSLTAVEVVSRQLVAQVKRGILSLSTYLVLELRPHLDCCCVIVWWMCKCLCLGCEEGR